MILSIKKDSYFNLFWLLFFLLFFGIPFKSFGFVKGYYGSEKGISPFLSFITFLKGLLQGNLGIISSILTFLYYSAFILLLIAITYIIIKKTARINENILIFFRKIDSFLDKILNVKQIYILSFLFLLTFLMRLIYINDGLLHHDSIQTALATEKTVETGTLHGITGNRYGYILINVIAYLIPHFIFNIQSAELIVTIVTILFASLSVIVIYLISKELFNNKYIAFSDLFSLRL